MKSPFSRRRRLSTLRPAGLIVLCLTALLLPLTIAAPAVAVNTSYYVDCSAGTNGSGTQASPWNSLASVNAPTFGAGDRILFRSGTTCTGQLAPKGSGSAAAPIQMSSYGSGNKPILDARGATGAVITLTNVQYWEVSNLELRNAATSPAYRSGLRAVNSSGGVLNHIWITNLTVRNVSGWSGGWYSTNAGIGIQTNHTSPTSTFNDIRVVGNTLENVDRIAIAVTPDYDGQGTGRTTNVLIQNNYIRYSGGDDILVVKGDGAVIDGNDAAYGGAKSLNACPPGGDYCNGASAGIWMAGSWNTVVQRNSVVCHVNGADGQGYDIDWGNRNTLVQYNYSRNNRGGMILIMPPINVPNEPTSQEPSDGIVIRYNVSEDDANTTGCPLQPSSQGPRDVIHFAGGIPNRSGSSAAQPEIYNNTIYIPTSRASYVIGSRSGVSTSGSFRFRNNLVVNLGTGGYVQTTGSTYTTNIMYGSTHSTQPANQITSNPQLIGPAPSGVTGITGAQGYQPGASSPALGAGTVISANGGRDFSGLPLPGSAPTIGAFEGAYRSGAVVSRVQSSNFTDRYIRHLNYVARIDANVSPAADAQFVMVPGLAGAAGVSFRSVNFPNMYLRHFEYELRLETNDGSATFAADATFIRTPGLSDVTKSSFQSWNFPDRFLRHQNYLLRIDPLNATSPVVDRQDATFSVVN